MLDQSDKQVIVNLKELPSIIMSL